MSTKLYETTFHGIEAEKNQSMEFDMKFVYCRLYKRRTILAFTCAPVVRNSVCRILACMVMRPRSLSSQTCTFSKSPLQAAQIFPMMGNAKQVAVERHLDPWDSSLTHNDQVIEIVC